MSKYIKVVAGAASTATRFRDKAQDHSPAEVSDAGARLLLALPD